MGVVRTDHPVHRELLQPGAHPESQRRALEAAGWTDFPARQEAARRAGRYIGLGLANYVEGTGRGPYTGALGYLNRNGDMDMNILIRSLWLQGDHVELRAGAGIVFDSVADAELNETRAKAEGLLRALGVAQ